MHPILAYWKSRVMAQPVRLLLNYVGVDFEDKYYPRTHDPEHGKASFRGIKDTLGLDFPNVPYYMDDDVKLTHMHAILRYLARKHGLCGNSDEESYRIDLAIEEIVDLRKDFVDVCYVNPQRMEEHLKMIRQKLPYFQTFLGNRQYIAGDRVTFVDFVVYEFLDEERTLIEGSLDGFDGLNAYLGRIEALPAIKKYMESDRFIKGPINGLTALVNNPAE